MDNEVEDEFMDAPTNGQGGHPKEHKLGPPAHNNGAHEYSQKAYGQNYAQTHTISKTVSLPSCL
jgi:hypothetical protein